MTWQSAATTTEKGILATPVFRLGSGAVVPQSTAPARPTDYQLIYQEKPALARVPLHRVLMIGIPMFFAMLFMLMMPAGGQNQGNSRDFNYRIPPSWSPENESNYSFRAYMTDISIWIMLTDLQPHQQCAAIVMRLGGAAREMSRMLSPQEMTHGGTLEPGGDRVDPVTYLLGSLHSRFSALEEESRLTSMTEMLAFSRRPGEGINALLARYETVRQRAALEGQFTMSVEGCALQILRACGISSQHLFTLLQPYGGQLPRNDAQFNSLCQQLRRHGYITEGAPGNIATSLHGPPRQARPGAYAVQDNRQALRDAAQRSSSNPGVATFLSQPRDGQGGNAWDTLLPTAVVPDPFSAWADNGTDGGERSLDTSGYYPIAQGASLFDSQSADTHHEVAGAYFADDDDRA